LRKFNSSGTKQWSALHGGAGSDVVYGMAVDSGGNVYINGNTNADRDGQVNSADRQTGHPSIRGCPVIFCRCFAVRLTPISPSA
jgi:hypothetical protein